MKFIAICAKGLEDITQLEIKEILKVSSKVLLPGRVFFSAKSVKKFLAQTQSAMKVYALKQECSTLEEVKPFSVVSPFRVVCSSKGTSYLSQEIEQRIGERFYEHGGKVNLEEPKTTIFVDIADEDHMLVGIDCTPELLSKRAYRVKIHNQSLNACVAYALVRLSGYKKGKIILDPFCKDGVIVVEAARFAKGKIFGYDDLFANVKNMEINATLAHVRKEITVSRIDVEWLDTKFSEGEVDCVVTALPFPSHSVPEKAVRKMYSEFFYHLKYILKKKGKVACIAPTLTLFKEMNENLKLVEERDVFVGNLLYSVVLYEK